jgi:NAD(P)H-hydrate epimerase
MGVPAGAGLGLDLVEVERFRKALMRHPRLEERLFTAAEIAYCRGRRDPVPSLAARFAGKEAIGKLLGKGILAWGDIEIVGSGRRDKRPGEWLVEEQAPRVILRGRTAQLARRQGIGGIRISLTHVESVAGACALAVASPTGENGEQERMGEVKDGNKGFHSLFERAAVFTPAQVRELDRKTIEELGMPGPVLMERAALGVGSLIQTRYPGRHTLFVCGPGNNGGDGLAAARQLHLAGHPAACVVYANSTAELSPDAALNFNVAEKAGVNLRVGEVPEYLWEETELVVDCLLGTGATGELRGRMIEAARLINAAGARGVPVLAVDMPSGVDATTGSLATGSVAADATITFHAAKSGLVCPPGSEAAGEVLVWDIGIPEQLEPDPDLWVVNADDANIPGRRVDDHKYRAGYLAVLAGSTAYPGAAWLSTQAAYRLGAGYVRLLMTSTAANGVRDRLVEGVLQEVGSGDFLTEAAPVLKMLADERLGALTIGPGLGREQATVKAVRQVVMDGTVPAVVDADGLFAFAGSAELLRDRPGLVLTPHLGELAALLGASTEELGASYLVAARRAAEVTGQVVLLKGSSTTVAAPSGDTRAVVQGPPQLATAGTGDVLSGVIGALLAKGLEPFEAAYAGAWIHAEAGRLGALTAPQGILAGDLVDLVAEVAADRLYEQGPSWRK